MKTYLLALSYVFVAQSQMLADDLKQKQFESPHEKSELVLDSSRSGVPNAIEIRTNGQLITKYPFEGEILNIMWSPSGKYVAFNNHSERLGWWIWVLSDRDGKIISRHGAIDNVEYNRYTDYSYLPDVEGLAFSRVEKMHPEFKNAKSRFDPMILAYGWTERDQLLIAGRFLFDSIPDDFGVYFSAKIATGLNLSVAEDSTEVYKLKKNRVISGVPNPIKKILDFK